VNPGQIIIDGAKLARLKAEDGRRIRMPNFSFYFNADKDGPVYLATDVFEHGCQGAPQRSMTVMLHIKPNLVFAFTRFSMN